ncbi:MAG: molybdopterin molybdotransferase MoeA, partial [Nitrospinae bacterium]|nr:molybdopterin molybdotransferase MoeA [Nitrospinota bacterium]
MIPVDKALQIIVEKSDVIERTETVGLDSANGRILAEDIFSDIDIPPFNKSSMDGYAVISEDLTSLPAELDVIEEIPAGYFPTKRVIKGTASKIMTGAPVSEGADAVVMVENTEDLQGKVKILSKVKKGDNISIKGEDVKKGEKILSKGTKFRCQEISMLASTGNHKVKVLSRPKVSILATGTELVEPDRFPSFGQIRNSNSYSLFAQCQSAGANPEYLGISVDEEKDLMGKIKKGLDSDMLLISGGVSMGDYDFVPSILKEADVKIVFEKVAIKPGKPVLFGTKGKTLVFGMPGNPVSTMVIFELFVKPALKKMSGDTANCNFKGKARLNKDFKRKRAERQEYIPAAISCSGGKTTAIPVESHGSADMMSLTKANG